MNHVQGRSGRQRRSLADAGVFPSSVRLAIGLGHHIRYYMQLLILAESELPDRW